MFDRSSSARRPGLKSAAAALLIGSMLAASPFAILAQDAPPATEAPAGEAPAAETPAPAAPAPVAPDTVIATVGDMPITEADLMFAAEDIPQLQQIPPEERRAFLLSVLIDTKLMAQAARVEALDQTEEYQRHLQYLQEQVLRRIYFSEKVVTGVTPEAIDAAYQTFVANFSRDEVHVQHILVASKEEADAVKAELASGKPFEVLAMEKSTDPSAQQNGGDLGFLQRGMTVQPFEDAAFALTEVGQISDPVESNFGWHVIKLVEKRQVEPPAKAEVEQQIFRQLLVEGSEKVVNELKTNVTIDIPDADLAAAVAAQMAQGTP